MIALSIRQEGTLRCLSIRGDAVREHAPLLEKKLRELLRTGQHLEVRLDGLERIDYVTLDLLCTAHCRAMAAGKTLQLRPSGWGRGTPDRLPPRWVCTRPGSAGVQGQWPRRCECGRRSA